MPNVRTIGSQSAASDDHSGARAATAFSPCSDSWMPLRKNQPAMQNVTLAMNGIRQPHAAASASGSAHLTSSAEPEPRMKPSVVPAAVELDTRPRIRGDAISVVYTIEPVN